MHNRVRVAGALSIVFVAIVTALSFSSRPSFVDVVGHVYEPGSMVRAPDGGPAAGAVVSNDQDSSTATTNAQGEFRLRVRRVATDEFIKFTARSGERTGYHLRIGSSKPGPVEIVLNNPKDQLGR